MTRPLLLLLAVLVAPAARAQSFQGLGDLPGGTAESAAFGVSADGAVVVGYSTSANGREAFRWASGVGMVGLGDLPGGDFASDGRAASADGAVVVGLGSSAASAVDFSPEAYRWTGAGMVGLGDLPGSLFWSEAYGVSADGAVVVGFGRSASGFEAFRWTAGAGMAGLGDLAGGTFNSVAYATSADGSVVVGQGASASGFEAFRWTLAGGMAGLGDLPGGTFSSAASAVSADGAVVVGAGRTASGPEAFVWTSAGGMRNLRDVLVNLGLDLTGWTLSAATGVSADGRVVVGYGTNPGGNQEAWRAELSPLTAVEAPPVSAGGLSVRVGPNPARGAATVALAVGTAGPVRVEVYGVLGRRVAVVHDGALAAGAHALRVDLSALPAGVYVVRAVAGSAVAAHRLVVLR